MRGIYLVCLLGVSLPALAQEESATLDRIEVTGSRISYRDLLDTPAVALTKSGDYLLQEVQLANDSRDEATRKRELHETIRKLISSAGGRFRVLHGDAYRVALSLSNADVPLEPDARRQDSSLITLQVRAELGDPKAAEGQIAELRKFVESATKVGRTLIEAKGETALGMNRPERYRLELLAAIAKDSQQLMQAMAMACKVELDGLNSRIEWERVSAGELLLYIPYSMTIRDCRASGNQPG